MNNYAQNWIRLGSLDEASFLAGRETSALSWVSMA